jgi:hypothetical protein
LSPRFGAGLQQAEIGPGLWLGQAHGAGPAAFDDRLHEALALPLLAVHFHRVGGALGQQRIEAPGQIAGLENFGGGVPSTPGSAWPPYFSGLVRPVQPPSANWLERFLEALRRGDVWRGLVVVAAFLVAGPVGRRQQLFAETAGFFQHGIEQVAAVGLAACNAVRIVRRRARRTGRSADRRGGPCKRSW